MYFFLFISKMLINQSFGRKYIKTQLTKQKMFSLLYIYTLNTVQLSLLKYYCFYKYQKILQILNIPEHKLLFVSGQPGCFMFHVSGEPGCFLSDLRHERHVFCPANSDPPPLLENIRSCQVIQDFLFMSRAGVNTGMRRQKKFTITWKDFNFNL